MCFLRLRIKLVSILLLMKCNNYRDLIGNTYSAMFRSGSGSWLMECVFEAGTNLICHPMYEAFLVDVVKAFSSVICQIGVKLEKCFVF